MQPRLGCDRTAGSLTVFSLEYCASFYLLFCRAVTKKLRVCKCYRSRVLKLWLCKAGFPYLHCLFAFAVFRRVSRSSHYILHTLIIPVTCNPLNYGTGEHVHLVQGNDQCQSCVCIFKIHQKVIVFLGSFLKEGPENRQRLLYGPSQKRSTLAFQRVLKRNLHLFPPR